jgi:geranylgeranyl reductase family protein
MPSSGISKNNYEVIIIGAGPGGSSVATFLARQGISCLLLDRAKFPREKVCGDGLTPQALYWLDQLGCADEALGHTACCVNECDLHINGRRILTGRFPQDSVYPGFCTLLSRKELDGLLVRNAVANGVHFIDGCKVNALSYTDDGVLVEGGNASEKRRFRARLLIGADGAGSMASRFIGNNVTAGTKALSMRAYFSDVKIRGAQIKVFFDDYLFPGYGWIFADDHGVANVGVGCVSDPLFDRPIAVRRVFERFIASSAADFLGDAKQDAAPAGGWVAFSKLQRIAADRVMLIGDAANHTDPLNGGGIHKAMEDAALVSRIAASALYDNDCSLGRLKTYEDQWEARFGADWRSAELLLSFAKNPFLRSVYLLMLERIGIGCERSRPFADFCAGVFSSVSAQSAYLSPLKLLAAMPWDPRVWLNGSDFVRSSISLGAKTILACMQSGREAFMNPWENLHWLFEIGKKIIDVGFFVSPSASLDTTGFPGFQAAADLRSAGPAS